MEIEFKRPTIYVSHPIRGTTGDIAYNCAKASAAARRLRRVFPEIDFYVPAEHDLTMQCLVSDERITIDDVMYADLKILDAADGWMFYAFDESEGSQIEGLRATELGLAGHGLYQTVFGYDIEKISYEKLRKDFEGLIEAARLHHRQREV